jgi:hypothetical protein
MLEHPVLDFTRLDAVSAHLQLTVLAAQKLYLSIRGPPAEIAGAVDADRKSVV